MDEVADLQREQPPVGWQLLQRGAASSDVWGDTSWSMGRGQRSRKAAPFLSAFLQAFGPVCAQIAARKRGCEVFRPARSVVYSQDSARSPLSYAFISSWALHMPAVDSVQRPLGCNTHALGLLHAYGLYTSLWLGALMLPGRAYFEVPVSRDACGRRKSALQDAMTILGLPTPSSQVPDSPGCWLLPSCLFTRYPWQCSGAAQVHNGAPCACLSGQASIQDCLACKRWSA